MTPKCAMHLLWIIKRRAIQVHNTKRGKVCDFFAENCRVCSATNLQHQIRGWAQVLRNVWNCFGKDYQHLTLHTKSCERIHNLYFPSLGKSWKIQHAKHKYVKTFMCTNTSDLLHSICMCLNRVSQSLLFPVIINVCKAAAAESCNNPSPLRGKSQTKCQSDLRTTSDSAWDLLHKDDIQMTPLVTDVMDCFKTFRNLRPSRKSMRFINEELRKLVIQ